MTKNPGHKHFQTILSQAEAQLWVAFEQARAFTQRGDIGDTREDAVTKFLGSQLPSRYGIASGEVMDTFGNTTGQIDLLIYDATTTRPLFEIEKTVLLPAEALLATVEIKSTLTRSETSKAVTGIGKTHGLRPWDAAWAAPRREGKAADDRLPRIFTSIFAYKTDLAAADWGSKELLRTRDCCKEQTVSVQHIDRVAVLDRGLILPSRGSVAQPRSERGVLGLWFFQLINFLSREVERRDPFPWDNYKVASAGVWTRVAPPIFDAPETTRATTSQRQRARKSRNRKLGTEAQ